MAASNIALPDGSSLVVNTCSTLMRDLKYGGVRVATLIITLVISLYLTILVASSGSYIDKV